MTPCSHNLNSHNLNSHDLNSHDLNSHDLNCHNLKSYDLNCHNLNSLMRVNKSAFIRWRDCHCHIPFPQWLTWASAPTRWSATPSPTSSASATASGTWHVRLELFRPGVLNLFLLAYPQIKMNPLRVPPNQNWPLLVPQKLPLILFYWAYFDINYISAYPLRTACVPPGVRVPQVENRWFRQFKSEP